MSKVAERSYIRILQRFKILGPDAIPYSLWDPPDLVILTQIGIQHNKHHHFSIQLIMSFTWNHSPVIFQFLTCFLKSLSSFPSSLYESPGPSTTCCSPSLLYFLYSSKLSLCLKTLSLLSFNLWPTRNELSLLVWKCIYFAIACKKTNFSVQRILLLGR